MAKCAFPVLSILIGSIGGLASLCEVSHGQIVILESSRSLTVTGEIGNQAAVDSDTVEVMSESPTFTGEAEINLAIPGSSLDLKIAQESFSLGDAYTAESTWTQAISLLGSSDQFGGYEIRDSYRLRFEVTAAALFQYDTFARDFAFTQFFRETPAGPEFLLTAADGSSPDVIRGTLMPGTYVIEAQLDLTSEDFGEIDEPIMRPERSFDAWLVLFIADGLGDAIASFGPCSPADFAAPFGELDIADVVGFLRSFGDGDPAADLAAPTGEFDIADVVEFLRVFGAGCP